MKITSSRPFVALLGVLFVLGGVHALGQAPAAGRQKITFLAMGADGQPIPDLQASQVEVRIDGKPRPAQSVRLVRLAGKDAAPAAGPKSVFDNAVPPPFGTNIAEPSRLILLAIDEESMRPGSDKVLKDALDQFLNGLGAQDRVGLVTMPRGTIRVEPTSNKTTVREVVARLSGRQQPTRNDNDDLCHARDVLEGLNSSIPMVGDGPATVVVFTSGLVTPSATTKPNNSSSVSCEVTTSDFQKVGSAAAAAHATVYVIFQQESGSRTGDLPGVQNLAGIVNSPLLYLTGGDGAFPRVLRESAAYYVAEIDYEAADRDGKSHRLEVKVNAPGANVRGPSEVAFSKADAKGTKIAAKDIVKETKIYTDFPIRTIGFVSKGTGEKIKIVAMVEPVDPGAKFASVSIGLVDTGDKSGKMISYSAGEQDLAKPSIITALEVPPGTYRLHAAAVDSAGRAGSADYMIDANLVPAGPMKMSGLLLAVNTATGQTPKMEFKDDKEVTAFFELYGTTTAGISALAELAETPDGPALLTADPGSKTLTLNPTNEPGRYTVLATFDLSTLKPGDYVIRATFTVQDTPPGKVFRTLRKVK